MAEVITDVTPSKTADDMADALLQAKLEDLEAQVARLEAELNKPGGPARVAGSIKSFFGAIGRLLSKKQSPTARAIRTGIQGVIASLLGVLALTVVPYVQGVIVNYAAAHLPEIVTASGVSIAIISLLMNLVEQAIQRIRLRFVSTDDASQA